MFVCQDLELQHATKFLTRISREVNDLIEEVWDGQFFLNLKMFHENQTSILLSKNGIECKGSGMYLNLVRTRTYLFKYGQEIFRNLCNSVGFYEIWQHKWV